MSKSSDWHLRVNEGKSEDDGYDMWLAEQQELEYWREKAEQHILNVWVEEVQLELDSIGVHWNNKHKVDLTTYKESKFFEAIWHASTEILPALEVQVVIDGENNCYVTTGSSGYVEFGMKPPVGMKLPIKCWIHTHPFGSAYFSGTDIRTVSIWERRMQEAFVLGGAGYTHYGHWEQDKPKQLAIYRYGALERTQYWGVKDEEE